MKVLGVRGGREADDYSTSDNISYFTELGNTVIGIKSDYVIGYRFISFRDSVYRDFWYNDMFTDHRLHLQVIRIHLVQVQVHQGQDFRLFVLLQGDICLMRM